MQTVSVFPIRDIGYRVMEGETVERGFFLFCLTCILALLITSAATNIVESPSKDVILSVWEIRETYGSNVWTSSTERLHKSGCTSGASRFQLLEAVLCVALVFTMLDIFFILMEYLDRPVFRRVGLIGFVFCSAVTLLAWFISLLFMFVSICPEGTARDTLSYAPLSRDFSFGASFITLSSAVVLFGLCYVLFIIRRIVDLWREKKEVGFIAARRARRQKELDDLIEYVDVPYDPAGLDGQGGGAAAAGEDEEMLSIDSKEKNNNDDDPFERRRKARLEGQEGVDVLNKNSTNTTRRRVSDETNNTATVDIFGAQALSVGGFDDDNYTSMEESPTNFNNNRNNNNNNRQQRTSRHEGISTDFVAFGTATAATADDEFSAASNNSNSNSRGAVVVPDRHNSNVERGRVYSIGEIGKGGARQNRNSGGSGSGGRGSGSAVAKRDSRDDDFSPLAGVKKGRRASDLSIQSDSTANSKGRRQSTTMPESSRKYEQYGGTRKYADHDGDDDDNDDDDHRYYKDRFNATANEFTDLPRTAASSQQRNSRDERAQSFSKPPMPTSSGTNRDARWGIAAGADSESEGYSPPRLGADGGGGGSSAMRHRQPSIVAYMGLQGPHSSVSMEGSTVAALVAGGGRQNSPSTSASTTSPRLQRGGGGGFGAEDAPSPQPKNPTAAGRGARGSSEGGESILNSNTSFANINNTANGGSQRNNSFSLRRQRSKSIMFLNDVTAAGGEGGVMGKGSSIISPKQKHGADNINTNASSSPPNGQQRSTTNPRADRSAFAMDEDDGIVSPLTLKINTRGGTDPPIGSNNANNTTNNRTPNAAAIANAASTPRAFTANAAVNSPRPSPRGQQGRKGSISELERIPSVMMKPSTAIGGGRVGGGVGLTGASLAGGPPQPMMAFVPSSRPTSANVLLEQKQQQSQSQQQHRSRPPSSSYSGATNTAPKSVTHTAVGNFLSEEEEEDEEAASESLKQIRRPSGVGVVEADGIQALDIADDDELIEKSVRGGGGGGRVVRTETAAPPPASFSPLPPLNVNALNTKTTDGASTMKSNAPKFNHRDEFDFNDDDFN